MNNVTLRAVCTHHNVNNEGKNKCPICEREAREAAAQRAKERFLAGENI